MSTRADDRIPLPQPPAAGTRGRRTHDAIVDAMERLLARGGYPAATTTAIADEAGVSVGTVYQYFSDRDDVLATLFAARLDGVLDRLATVMSTDRLLDEGLDAVVRHAVDEVVRTYRAESATFRAALVQLPSSPGVRAVYWDRHERSQALTETFLRRAQAAGMVRDADPGVLAETMLVVLQGLNHPRLLATPRARRTRAIVDEITALLIRLLSA